MPSAICQQMQQDQVRDPEDHVHHHHDNEFEHQLNEVKQQLEGLGPQKRPGNDCDAELEAEQKAKERGPYYMNGL
jgi:hypothetical protein